MRTLLCFLLLACSQPTTTSKNTAAVNTALTPPNSSCFDPGVAPYNAVPNDGVSDRVALQAAADDAAAWSVAHSNAPTFVCLGAGTWTCDRAPIGSYNRNACVSVHMGTVIFSGVGEATKVALVGDQQLADIVVISHDPGSSGGAQDLMVVSNQVFNTSEQTHMLGTTGACSGTNCQPIRNLSYRRIICDHPPATDGSRKGDCIRALGNTSPAADGSTPGTNIYGLVIEDSQFRRCARSGIQPQRGVHDAIIRRNEFWCDQPIHGEASGFGDNVNIEVTQNVFHNLSIDGTPFSSDVDIQLSGASSPYQGIHIHHNTLGRGINLYRTSNVEIDHETITMNASTAYGVIEIGNKCDGLNIHDVTAIRAGGIAGPVLRLMPHGTAICQNAVVKNNVFSQNTRSQIIYTEAINTVLFDTNVLTWLAPAPGMPALYVRSTTAPVSNLLIRGNQISGFGAYGFVFAAAPYPFALGNELSNNTTTDITSHSLTCGGAGGFSSMVFYGNTFGTIDCAGVTFTSP